MHLKVCLYPMHWQHLVCFGSLKYLSAINLLGSLQGTCWYYYILNRQIQGPLICCAHFLAVGFTFYECAQYFRHSVSCAKWSDWKACRARVFRVYTCSSSVSGIYEAFWSFHMMVSLCCHYCQSCGIYKSLNMGGWCQVALPGMAERGSKVLQTIRYD
jgi:hypothetical protein